MPLFKNNPRRPQVGVDKTRENSQIMEDKYVNQRKYGKIKC